MPSLCHIACASKADQILSPLLFQLSLYFSYLTHRFFYLLVYRRSGNFRWYNIFVVIDNYEYVMHKNYTQRVIRTKFITFCIRALVDGSSMAELLDHRRSLSQSVPSRAIAAANREVM